MLEENAIRETRIDELARILAMYPLAFPDEELRPIATKLIEGNAQTLSLAAFHKDTLIGHVIFTLFSGAGSDDYSAGALLGPLCVVPEHQSQGVGSALVRHGIERLTSMGIRQVFVFGDPNYYGRFGFQQELRVLPPYALSEEWAGAWQSMTLPDSKPLEAGQCLLPEEWMERALWES